MNFKIIVSFVLFVFLYSCQGVDNKDNTEVSDTLVTKEKALEELELIDKNPIKQLVSFSNARFDLSGICLFNDSVYVVADKVWNKAVYKIDTLGKNVNIISKSDVCVFEKIDFEGVVADEKGFYLINERKSEVYFKTADSCLVNVLDIDWSQVNENVKVWRNKGLEGIALDKENRILYLIKERTPRKVFVYNLETKQLTEPFKELFNKDEGDFTDAKFENGKLYLLERNSSQIMRIDVKNKQTYSISIKNTLNPNGKRLYKTDNLEYGTAEALLLTDKNIWIGIDNNGENTSEYGQSLGLDKTNSPAIIVFKRPENF